MNNPRFNFNEYSLDDLEYTLDVLERLMGVWHSAEIALNDAHTRHDEEETLTDWLDVYHAAQEVKAAIKNYDNKPVNDNKEV